MGFGAVGFYYITFRVQKCVIFGDWCYMGWGSWLSNFHVPGTLIHTESCVSLLDARTQLAPTSVTKPSRGVLCVGIDFFHIRVRHKRDFWHGHKAAATKTFMLLGADGIEHVPCHLIDPPFVFV